MTTAEAAQRLGVTAQRIYQLRDAGTLPYVVVSVGVAPRFCKQCRYRRADVEALAASRARAVAARAGYLRGIA